MAGRQASNLSVLLHISYVLHSGSQGAAGAYLGFLQVYLRLVPVTRHQFIAGLHRDKQPLESLTHKYRQFRFSKSPQEHVLDPPRHWENSTQQGSRPLHHQVALALLHDIDPALEDSKLRADELDHAALISFPFTKSHPLSPSLASFEVIEKNYEFARQERLFVRLFRER